MTHTPPSSAPLAPGARIGILGGGQLGRMLAVSAAELGFNCHIYCPEENPPAGEVAASTTCAAYEDEAALTRFAESVDVVTYEFENVPEKAAALLEAHVPVRPGPLALATAQDRLTEKTFLREAGIATAPFAAVSSLEDLKQAVETIGRPSILKTRRFGYDGKGQVKIEGDTDLAAAFEEIGKQPAILEGFVPFTREISVIVARGTDGGIAAYDPGENIHKNHILHTTTVPAAIGETTAAEAMEIARKLIGALSYIGVMGVEMFHLETEGALVVNEIAPRVHNSGHWTQDGCAVSQFEQHIRAITGWPLGDPARHADTQMLNLIGDDAHNWQAFAQDAKCHVHLYGKKEARPGRKMGHVNRIRALSR
jgi:5-(carboxyamino)imidazole ribonucleotide synthase